METNVVDVSATQHASTLQEKLEAAASAEAAGKTGNDEEEIMSSKKMGYEPVNDMQSYSIVRAAPKQDETYAAVRSEVSAHSGTGEI